MKFKKTDVAGAVEILASNDFTAIPFTTTTAKKAGEKLTVDSRVGVVLYDVDPAENPNASLLIRGVIDTKKAAASSSFTFDADAIKALKTAVPGIFCRDNIGVNA